MIGGSHDGFATKSLNRSENPLIVSRHNDFIETRASLAALPNMLNQRFPGNDVEWLSGETGGAPTGGENS
jgi:hypothetical protein